MFASKKANQATTLNHRLAVVPREKHFPVIIQKTETANNRMNFRSTRTTAPWQKRQQKVCVQNTQTTMHTNLSVFVFSVLFIWLRPGG